jgi:hypothetical protein
MGTRTDPNEILRFARESISDEVQTNIKDFMEGRRNMIHASLSGSFVHQRFENLNYLFALFFTGILDHKVNFRPGLFR